MTFDWFNYANCCIESLALILFWMVLAQRRCSKSAVVVTYLLLCTAAIAVTFVDSILFSILPVNFCLIFLCFFIGCYKTKQKDNLLQTVFAYAALLFLELIFLCLLPTNLMKTQWGNLVVNLSVLFCALLLTAISAKFHLASKYAQNKKTVWLFLVTLFLPEIIICQLFMVNYYNIHTTNMLFLLLVQVLYIVLLAFILLAWRQRLQNKQLTETKKYISTLNEYLDDARQRSHDFHKHIRFLQHMVDTEPDTKKLVKRVDAYCNELTQEAEADDVFLYLDNPVFRALLYGRSSQAKRQNIKLIVNASKLLPDFPLQNFQLVEVFDNLIDNAFECAAELSEEKRWIRITLEAASRKDGTTRHFMSIENPYDRLNFSAIVSDERYTTKAGNHQGIGLQRVAKIVNHTGGQLILNQDNHIFTVKVIYNCP